jgi:hypothetical protein
MYRFMAHPLEIVGVPALSGKALIQPNAFLLHVIQIGVDRRALCEPIPITTTPRLMVGFAELVIGPATSGRTRWLYPPYASVLTQASIDARPATRMRGPGVRHAAPIAFDVAHGAMLCLTAFARKKCGAISAAPVLIRKSATTNDATTQRVRFALSKRAIRALRRSIETLASADMMVLLTAGVWSRRARRRFSEEG